jgi:hypothetical protein
MAVEPDPHHILPPPMIDGPNKTETYSIAVFHQLHCLVSLVSSPSSNWTRYEAQLTPIDEFSTAS